MPCMYCFTGISNHGEAEKDARINSFNDMFQAVASVGDWRGLCMNLGVSESTLDTLKYSTERDIAKKRNCLEACFNTGEATWEKLANTVEQFPINNKRLAQSIREKFIY